MNYFKALTEECEKLDDLGQKYLDKFEFLPNDQIAERIFRVAKRLLQEANDDWNKIPEWAAMCLDYGVPYTQRSKNGSIFYALGFSCVSQDAHLRNLLEIAEGRETKELDFPVVVNKKEFDEKMGLEERTPPTVNNNFRSKKVKKKLT